MIKSLYRFLSPRFQNLFLDYPVDMKPRDLSNPHSLLYAIVDEQREVFKSHLSGFLGLENELKLINPSNKEQDDNLPSWNNGFLPGLDIVALYGMIRLIKPKLYIEIGSGNSTKVVRKSIQAGELETKIISIDPVPRANIDHLADEVHRFPVENLNDHSLFNQLDRGDVLFIDNSHRCLPNSDVTVCFLEILPRLKPGVIVHIHDIYVPYDYPQFMCDRAYSEQYVLAAMILANPKKYKPILANYFISEDEELRQILQPIWKHDNLKGVEQHGGSFWIEIG